jgi:hypothetical protein
MEIRRVGNHNFKQILEGLDASDLENEVSEEGEGSDYF